MINAILDTHNSVNQFTSRKLSIVNNIYLGLYNRCDIRYNVHMNNQIVLHAPYNSGAGCVNDILTIHNNITKEQDVATTIVRKNNVD